MIFIYVSVVKKKLPGISGQFFNDLFAITNCLFYS